MPHCVRKIFLSLEDRSGSDETFCERAISTTLEIMYVEQQSYCETEIVALNFTAKKYSLEECLAIAAEMLGSTLAPLKTLDPRRFGQQHQ